MKKIALTVALAIFGLTASYAQKVERAHPTPEQRAEKSAAKLQTDLALDSKQKDAVYRIQLDKFKHNEALHKANHEVRFANKDKQKAFAEANRAQLEKVFTADQKAKFASLKQGRKEHKKGSGHGKDKAAKSKA